ncbi:hypothetical protein ONS95_002202 [Cadophora gregata]|uniref:uncharacterized protein n=1 Tax=Cadophora gregata TaxID=51156 RepID=UPI0026DCF18B|nr:uncharacterized protein ONS95_002202 [Cadophora gregata]KAK0109513.1 hypothetical protein ONS95_002202 [Cadophora gregata]
MDPNHSSGFVPSFSVVARHIASRFGTLILKILSFVVTVLLTALLSIGVAFWKLARWVLLLSSKIWTSIFAARRERFMLDSSKETGSAGQGHGRSGQEIGLAGRNGVPEGWVRYVICRTEDISDLDLEKCEGCHQVLETEIEMLSGNGDSIEELAERQKRVGFWLEEIERLDRDSGYSSPDAEGGVGREIFWGLQGC